MARYDRRVWISAAAGLAAAAVSRRLWRMRRALDLRAKVVLITGGSRGLGYALARKFARRGAKLVLCARDPAELDRAGTALEERGAEVLVRPCDVTSRAEVEHLVRAAVERFGGIDVLVANAGIMTVGPLATQTLEDFENAMRVMYWGVVYPALAVLPHMRARGGGRIGVVTSIGGKLSVPHLLPYSGAKFAAVGFAEGLRAELAREGIAVTTVVPWLMRTGSHLNAWFKGRSGREFSWFALAATLPGVALDPYRAARRIVDAVVHGDAVLAPLPARLAMIAAGLFPGLVADAMALANRLLPHADSSAPEAQRGRESAAGVTRTIERLTARGREAAGELLQHPVDTSS